MVGRKKLTGKEKKLKRNEETAREQLMESRVKAACNQENVLAAFAPFMSYNRNDLDLQLEYTTGPNLPTDMKTAMQALLKLNMAPHYGDRWPAAEKEKRREMVDDDTRYVILRPVKAVDDTSTAAVSVQSEGAKVGAEPSPSAKPPAYGDLAGFVNFRFLVEEGVAVLYVYELQLQPSIRGHGLGKFLMQLMELVARKNSMEGVMLTVQTNNERAMDFYTKRLKYIVMPISPSRADPLSTSNYEILGKVFDPAVLDYLGGA